MSEIYEGVVFCSDELIARRTFTAHSVGLQLRFVRLAGEVFGIYRVAGRSDSFDQPTVEQIAQEVSTAVGRSIALFYDNSCDIRVGVLYRGGHRDREFGDGDAWWAPYGEQGELVLDGPRLRVTDLLPNEEYDCIFSAIDAGLEAVGAGPHVSASLVKQAFCYEELAKFTEL